ncbi:MAG: MoaD/ThiS family protein [Thermodesulfobacteriota bacterium]
MKITIKMGGPLRKRIPGHVAGELILDLSDEANVSDALTALGLEPDEVRVIMKNGRAIHSDESLADGDRLGLFSREQAFNTITAISFFNPLARKKID